MTNLDKIFTGMKEGPEVIQKNFDILAANDEGSAEYRHVMSPNITGAISDGLIIFYRKGNIVQALVKVQITKALSWDTIINQFPAGYTVGENAQGVLGSTGLRGSFMTIYIENGALKGLTNTDIPDGKHDFGGFLTYRTIDDPPTGERVLY